MSQMACIIHIHVFDSCLLYSVQVGSISNAASDISTTLMLSNIYIKINIRDWKRTIQIECQLICGNLQSGIFLDFIIDLNAFYGSYLPFWEATWLIDFDLVTNQWFTRIQNRKQYRQTVSCKIKNRSIPENFIGVTNSCVNVVDDNVILE